MKVGIVGGGAVGSSLGKALIKAGHEVMFSSRDPHGEHAQKVAAETGAVVGSVADTIDFSTAVVLAMPAEAAMSVAGEFVAQLKDKVIIDLVNRRGLAVPGGAGSFALDLAAKTGGRVVKAFNTIGAEHYQNPVFDGQRASMFIAGDDPQAKHAVADLAASIGFDVVDCGGLENSPLVENLASLWIYLALRSGLGRNIAIKLLRRQG
jgi:predicted dinucleotide-binding enzyme